MLDGAKINHMHEIYHLLNAFLVISFAGRKCKTKSSNNYNARTQNAVMHIVICIKEECNEQMNER